MVNVFDNPTRQTFYMELVGPDHLRNAVTLYSTLVNLARIIGPAIAAAVIAAFGLAPCFIINGISFAAVVIMLAMLHADELFITPPVPPAKGQLVEGFKYVVSTPVLGSTLLMMAIIGTLTYEFQVSLPLIAQFTFKGNASSYAFLTAAMGVGAACGGILFASRKGVIPYKLVSAALLFGLAVLAAAFMPIIHLAALAMLAVGICSINFSSLGQQCPAIAQLAADARAGHVLLVGGFPGFHHHWRADRRLVCRSGRCALGPGAGRPGCPGRRRSGRVYPAQPADCSASFAG